MTTTEIEKRSAFNSYVIPYEDLTLGDQIGGGATSIVYKGCWKRYLCLSSDIVLKLVDRCPVAIKKWFDPKCEQQVLEEFNAEFMTIRELRHPNIIQFLGVCARPSNLCLVLEYLPISLHYLLHQTTTELTTKRCEPVSR